MLLNNQPEHKSASTWRSYTKAGLVTLVTGAVYFLGRTFFVGRKKGSVDLAGDPTALTLPEEEPVSVFGDPMQRALTPKIMSQQTPQPGFFHVEEQVLPLSDSRKMNHGQEGMKPSNRDGDNNLMEGGLSLNKENNCDAGVSFANEIVGTDGDNLLSGPSNVDNSYEPKMGHDRIRDYLSDYDMVVLPAGITANNTKVVRSGLNAVFRFFDNNGNITTDHSLAILDFYRDVRRSNSYSYRYVYAVEKVQFYDCTVSDLLVRAEGSEL